MLETQVDKILKQACEFILNVEDESDFFDGTTDQFTIEKKSLKASDEIPAIGFFNSFGSLTRFADTILPLFPRPTYKKYVELFCGKGEMVWYHKRGSETEYMNDIDKGIVRLHTLCQKMTDDQLRSLTKFDWTGKRSTFECLVKNETIKSDLGFFHRELYIRRFSKSGRVRPRFQEWAEGQVCNMFKRIIRCRERLQGVNIINSDYQATLKKLDSTETFFFVDPPYPDEGGYYPFKMPDLKEQSALYKNAKGKMMIVIEGSNKSLAPLRELNWKEVKFKWPRSWCNSPNGPKQKFVWASIFLNYDPSKGKSKKFFQPIDKAETVKIIVSGVGLRLPFEVCGNLKFIAEICKGRCCESKGKAAKVMLLPHEISKIKKRGGFVKGNLLLPKDGRKCYFKTEEHLCSLHSSGDKPFGCSYSPFTVNKNNLLQVRGRAIGLSCFKTKNSKPAYLAHKVALEFLIGSAEVARVSKLAKAGEDRIEAVMPKDKVDAIRFIEDSRNKLLKDEVSGIADAFGLSIKEVTKVIIEKVPVGSDSIEEKRAAQTIRAKKYGIESLEGKGERLSFSPGYPTDLDSYGDPVNLIFPFRPDRGARNVRLRFKEFAPNYDKETSKKIVHTRIVKRLLSIGATPSFDPENSLDKLLPQDIKDKLKKDEGIEKTIKFCPINKVDSDKQIAFGVVLEPDEVDSQNDTITAEEIEQAAHAWLAKYQDRGVMHTQLANGKIEIYESYVAPANLNINGQAVKKGTWLLMYHVQDKDLWKKIKSGQLTGFSMGGFARRNPV